MPEISRDTGQRGERMSMIVGDTLTIRVDAGDLVSAQSSDEPIFVTAGSEGAAVFEGLAEGLYWLSVKPSGEDTERLGSINVLPLADRTETRLRAEIKRLDDRIQSEEAVNVSVSGDGYSINRMGIRKLHEQRAAVQSQLNSYLRSRAGLGPTRWSR